MASMFTRFRYLALKAEYAFATSVKLLNSDVGLQSHKDLADVVRKSLNDRLTYLHWIRGEELPPLYGGKGGTLLVRKLPAADSRHVFVGDMVVLKDPQDSNEYLVRILAATEGDEMASNDENDEPFVLDKDECWVLAMNRILPTKEARDSRLFGPVPMTSIVGRAIYLLQNGEAHSPVVNSPTSTETDFPLLQVELDVEEMVKYLKE